MDQPIVETTGVAGVRGLGTWGRLTRRFPASVLGWVGAAMILVLVVFAVMAPVLTRAGILRDPTRQEADGLDADGLPKPPGDGYLLGTDVLGRDVLSRVVHGTRVSLAVGVAAMLTATALGGVVGVVAGYFGGRWDRVLTRVTEINMTIPGILLAVAFAGLLDGRTVHLHPAGWEWHGLDVVFRRGVGSLFVIIGFVCWPGMVRVIRAQVMVLKQRDFVLASRALGASHPRLIVHHIVPNLLPTTTVVAVNTIANAILLEVGLGYLGIGVPQPAPTWGSMIAEGQSYFASAPHLVLVPGTVILLTVLAFNLLGQGLQESFVRARRNG